MKTSAILSSIVATLFVVATPGTATTATTTTATTSSTTGKKSRTAGDVILAGFDTSGIDRDIYYELKSDLDGCEAYTCSEPDFLACVRRILQLYDTPDDLTYAEKRRTRRGARDYDFQHEC
jgi:hypothetical protein